MNLSLPEDSNLSNKKSFDDCLLKEILSLDSSWLPDRTIVSEIDQNFIINTNDPKDGDSASSKFSKHMIHVYEWGIVFEAQSINNDVFNKMEEWTDFCTAVFSEEPFFQKIRPAVQHILYGSEAYLMFKKGEYAKARGLVENAKSISLDSDAANAAVCGLKAQFLGKYGPGVRKMVLPLVARAMELDQNEPKWIYMKAKALRDVRLEYGYGNIDSDESLKEERELYRKLLEICKKPGYLTDLGAILIDLACILHNKFKQSGCECGPLLAEKCKQRKCCIEVENYTQEAVEYFRQALLLETPSKMTLRLIITGISSMVYCLKMQYKDLAKECVDKILEFDNDNNMGIDYLVVGKYFQRFEKHNREGMIYYFKKAERLGCTNAKKQLIIFKYQEDKNYDPCEDIMTWYTEYPSIYKKVEAICQIASYHLKIKHDLLTAVEEFTKAVEENPTLSSSSIKEHYSWFVQGPVENLLEVIINKVYCKLNFDAKVKTPSYEHDRLMEFWKLVDKTAPDLCNKVKLACDKTRHSWESRSYGMSQYYWSKEYSNSGSGRFMGHGIHSRSVVDSWRGSNVQPSREATSRTSTSQRSNWRLECKKF